MNYEYTHGGDIYRNKIEYDFSVNINPLGMPSACFDIAEKISDLAGCYPDYSADKLAYLLAVGLGTKRDNIMLTNGAAELIYLIAAYARISMGEGFKALTLAPTFSEYERAVCAYGGVMDYVELKEENCFDVENSIVDSITEDYKLLFLCNPNNPTGRIIDKALMKKIADTCKRKDVLFVVDECFIPFVGNSEEYSLIAEISNYDNLIILQAFTKIYGMPGVRLGYGVCGNGELRKALRNLTQPWNTSNIAQAMGYEALKDKDFVEKTIKYIARERAILYTELRNGLAKSIVPSRTNYILFTAERDLADRLIKHGIMIRRCGDFIGLSDEYFRIGVKDTKANQKLIEVWRNEYGNS